MKKRKIKLNQKGLQLNQLVSIILTIVIVTILVTIGIRIINGTKDAVKTDYTTNVGNYTTSSAILVNSTVSLPQGDLVSIGKVCNASSGGTCIPSANITLVNLVSGSFYTSDVNYNNSILNITYTMYQRTLAYNASNDMQGSLTEIASWGDLMGLAIAAGIILTIILGAFAFRR